MHSAPLQTASLSADQRRQSGHRQSSVRVRYYVREYGQFSDGDFSDRKAVGWVTVFHVFTPSHFSILNDTISLIMTSKILFHLQIQEKEADISD